MIILYTKLMDCVYVLLASMSKGQLYLEWAMSVWCLASQVNGLKVT